MLQVLLIPLILCCRFINTSPPLLQELLKHTDPEHLDYTVLAEARVCMSNVASLINERKRRLENVNKLARWQLTISNWRDEDLVLKSSDLVYKGLLNKVTNGKDVERVVFLFDHQMLYFKLDSTKRLIYSGRIRLDDAIIEDVVDHSFYIRGEGITNGWKIWNAMKKKWCYFYAASIEKKLIWLKSLQDERKLVKDELDKGNIYIGWYCLYWVHF